MLLYVAMIWYEDSDGLFGVLRQNCILILMGNLEESNLLEHLNVDGMMILSGILKN
jgi:hypothetical protein